MSPHSAQKDERRIPRKKFAPSDNVYEYIVFRGSDVKDLRIEEAPSVKENKPPQVPNDPAILGVSLAFPLYPRESLPTHLNGMYRRINDEVFRM